MYITATALNKTPGAYLEKAIREPVVVKKSGRPSVVIVSYDHYEELEDAFWGERAIQADKEPSLGVKKTMQFLLEDED